jgi:hypothetical protein
MVVQPIKGRKIGVSGTLGVVRKTYFDNPGYVGYPFRQVCHSSNGPVEKRPCLQIAYRVDAETLESMAKAIRATKEDCLDETSI